MPVLHICALLLAAMCHPPKIDAALFFANIALTSADIHETYRLKAALRPPYYFKERDPLGRFFIMHLPEPASMSLAIGGDLLVANLGYRLRTSHRWTRHIWWAPQLALAAGNMWGIDSSVRNLRREIR
jgi:hypothetical protein